MCRIVCVVKLLIFCFFFFLEVGSTDLTVGILVKDSLCVVNLIVIIISSLVFITYNLEMDI